MEGSGRGPGGWGSGRDGTGRDGRDSEGRYNERNTRVTHEASLPPGRPADRQAARKQPGRQAIPPEVRGGHCQASRASRGPSELGSLARSLGEGPQPLVNCFSQLLLPSIVAACLPACSLPACSLPAGRPSCSCSDGPRQRQQLCQKNRRAEQKKTARL